ncbi:MAG: hypothetical protein ACT4QD_01095 [Acidobacteriota bacterium]
MFPPRAGVSLGLAVACAVLLTPDHSGAQRLPLTRFTKELARALLRSGRACSGELTRRQWPHARPAHQGVTRWR